MEELALIQVQSTVGTPKCFFSQILGLLYTCLLYREKITDGGMFYLKLWEMKKWDTSEALWSANYS